MRVNGNIWHRDGKDVVVNPITKYDAADPSFIKDGDYYYLFHTGKRGLIDRSRDLVNWEKDWSYVFPKDFDYDLISKELVNLWAFDVNRIDNRFVLYVAAWAGSDNTSFVFSMTSTSIEAPWKFEGVVWPSYSNSGPVRLAIDSEYVSDGIKDYLIVGSMPGLYMSQITSDGHQLVEPYWNIAKGVEGAYVYYYKGYYYLFASGGDYRNHTYYISLARSSVITGPYLNKHSENIATSSPSVILSSEKNDILYGPGHNGEIVVDKKGDMYMILHCHIRGLLEKDSYRPAIIMRLVEGPDGWLAFADVDGNIVTSPVWECSVPQL